MTEVYDNSRDRHQRAYELHLAGASYQQIADRLGYTDRSSARSAVLTELARHSTKHARESDLATERKIEIEEVPSELARLDAMLVGLWPKARRGDVHAVDRVLRIGERRDVLLERQDDQQPPIHSEETGLDEFTRRLSDRRRSGA